MKIQIVNFKTTYKGDKGTDWVMIAPGGEAFERTKTWHPVDRLRPPENPASPDAASYLAMKARWEQIEPRYKAWKAGEDVPEQGVPLAAWSGVTPEQAGLLKSMRILSVEDVRDMSESTFSKLPFPNARQLPKLAADFLASMGDVEKDQKIAEMQERMEAMEAMLAEKPKRGRPPKESAEAA